jgi:hypothetical protein
LDLASMAATRPEMFVEAVLSLANRPNRLADD